MAHQANARILTALAQRLDMPREKFPSNIAEVGHGTSPPPSPAPGAHRGAPAVPGG
ncbi:3-oxoacyl-[acyl-carrier-protein] synthase III C-terminal domain-containing protein [Streptomyces sp. KL116D]|uniref:3-oxoacyl-[acyl-carrier-protein] synthase III C-terminal domain-containing protein n=1 Tax=Streptomyces sp. KL116D TaxID=3045152 RepID=UPI0035576CCB